MMYYKYIVFQLFFMFISVLVASTHDDVFNSRVNFNVTGDGFHRTVNYQVIAKEINDNECHVALFLELPSALYVNVDELQDLQKFRNTTICSVGETDVELFAEEAKLQQIAMCVVKSTFNEFKLTIHQRYQRARDNETYANITLPKPRLLFGCKHRIKEYPVSTIDLCKPCVELTLKWREIPYNTETKNYTWIIPVGNISHQVYVTYITLFISLMGTIFILTALWQSNLHERIKNE